MIFRIEATGYLEWRVSDGASEETFSGDPTTPEGFAKMRVAAERLVGRDNGTLTYLLNAVEAFQSGASVFGPPVEELQARGRTVAWAADNPKSIQPDILCLGEVVPSKTDWLWEGHFPLGCISLIVGRPGEGKSFMSTDFAARISTGTPWPDGSPCQKGSVMYMVAEDDPARTVRPRLDAHNGDPWKIHVLKGGTTSDIDGKRLEMFYTLGDVEQIRTALSFRPDTRALFVDPIGSFLTAKTDAHRDNEVRGVLTPLGKMAEELNLAVILIAHRRKSGADFADDLVLGSRAFTGIARTVWHLSADPQNKGRLLFLPGKNNLARRQAGYAFSISGDGPFARLYWESGRVELSADEGLAAEKSVDKGTVGRPPTTRNAAETWLAALLAEGPAQTGDILKESEGAGFSWSTVKRAAELMGVTRKRNRFGGGWTWELGSVPD